MKKISRYQEIKAKDIIIADKAYGTIKGIEYVTKGADFSVSYKGESI